MGFYRTRCFRGKDYWYYEERWREGKKVRSRSTYVGPAGGGASASVGYASGNATAAYKREVDRVLNKLGVPIDALRDQALKTFEARQRRYLTTYPSPKSRAETAYLKIKHAVQDEDRRLDEAEALAKKNLPPKGSPTDEEEAQRAERRDAAKDANDRAATEYSKSSGE